MDSSRHKNTYMCIYILNRRQTLAAFSSWELEKKRERLLSVREKRRDGSRGVCGESWGWEMLWEAKSPPEHNAAPLIQAADMGSPPLREIKELRCLQTRDELQHFCTTGSAMETFALFARIVAFVLQSLLLVTGHFCEHFQPWGLLVNKLPLVYLILLLWLYLTLFLGKNAGHLGLRVFFCLAKANYTINVLSLFAKSEKIALKFSVEVHAPKKNILLASNI